MRALIALALLLGVTAPALGAKEPASSPKTPADWEMLDAYQKSMSREEFEAALDSVYAPAGRWKQWIRVEAEGAWVVANEEYPNGEYFFEFAGAESSSPASPASPPDRVGLQGLRVVLDPGHIGGDWSEMEERHFAIGDGGVVKEGDLTLATAKRLRDLLVEAGAKVWLTREDSEPVTDARPFDFYGEAVAQASETEEESAISRLRRRQQVAERLFYRTAEIQARAALINEELRPDIAIALHLNAVGWKDPEALSLSDRNEAHVIVNGGYLPSELAGESERLELMLRLAKRFHEREIPLAEAIVEAMVEVTDLPPYLYPGKNAIQLDKEGYLWARNLLANRIYDCPVVYLEPWILNSEAVYEWAAAGDYDGQREFHGVLKPSLPSVYAEFALAGLRSYYGAGE